MIDYVSIGKNIRKHRLRLRLTQEALAEKVYISTVHISRIENGAGQPSLQTLVDLCNALNITIDDLMCDSLPARQKQLEGRLAELLCDCSVDEINLVTDVVDVLLRDLRKWVKE